MLNNTSGCVVLMPSPNCNAHSGGGREGLRMKPIIRQNKSTIPCLGRQLTPIEHMVPYGV